MAPGRPVKNITVNVPRHNAQRTGLKLAAEIKKQARAKKILVDINMPHPELNPSIENASEWNSMLMTARAERGPQWDVGTQQFLVDEYSDLYYNPAPLLESIKKKVDEEKAEEQAQQAAQQQQQVQVHQMHQQHQAQHLVRHDSGHQEFLLTSVHQLNAMHSTRHHGPGPGHGPGPAGQYPYQGPPVANIPMRPPPPPHNGSPFAGGGPGGGASVGAGSGAPFNPIPTNQFYGADVGGSPARMGGMSGMGNMGNMAGMANTGNMAGIGNMGGMANMGNMAGIGGIGGVGNMGNMAGMGNMGNMGNMGSMGNMAGIANVGNLGGMPGMGGPMGMVDHAGAAGIPGHHPMGGMGGMGGGAGMPMNLSPARRMGRGGFGEESFGLA
ncbi:hypothetical protein APHAL10511_004481 [Amanita phalloides]|nr:hypothetical protein APHAL10511_004481 [Amanita phalloides]